VSLNKFDVLALGRGALTDNSNAIIAISSNNVVGTWSSSTTYAQYNVVEYSGKVYRSKIPANLNNQPDTSPSQWEVLYSGPKDGDVSFAILGSQSTIFQRQGGAWRDLVGQSVAVPLTDGQLTPADAVVFLASARPFAHIEYTVRRGFGHDRKRKGDFDILTDTSFSIEYSHSFTEIGSDVNVSLTPTISGGNVHLTYTSVNEGFPIELRYSIRGWA
jgi:hypothetical protein